MALNFIFKIFIRSGLSDVTFSLFFSHRRPRHTLHEIRPVRPAVVKRLPSAGFVPAAAAVSRRRWCLPLILQSTQRPHRHTHYRSNVVGVDKSRAVVWGYILYWGPLVLLCIIPSFIIFFLLYYHWKRWTVVGRKPDMWPTTESMFTIITISVYTVSKNAPTLIETV